MKAGLWFSNLSSRATNAGLPQIGAGLIPSIPIPFTLSGSLACF